MKTLKRTFDILTLSECNGCLNDNIKLGDPILVITGGVALVQSLFPNIFGGGRRALTNQDWQQLLPGNGIWTVRLRNHLSRTINYAEDLKNMEQFTRYFVYDHQLSFSGATFDEKFQRFLEIVEQEKYGKAPGPGLPGIPGTLNYELIIPLALGGLILIMLLKKKK